MLNSYVRALLNLLISRVCFVCAKKIPHGYLCDRCAASIPYLWPPLCRYCSKPLPHTEGPVCGNCSHNTYPFTALVSITAYREPMVYLLHLFKYQHYDYLAGFFAQLMVTHLQRMGYAFDSDWIVPVPMHRYKLKKRGYNQAGLIGQALSKHFGIPFRNDIIRAVTNKPSQTTLSPNKRKANVREAFTAAGEVKAKKVLLVDDIMTTGATAFACAHALQRQGAKNITVITVAKTL